MNQPDPHPNDLVAIAQSIRYDLTSLQAKVTDLLNTIGRLNLPDPKRVVCPDCRISLAGARSLAEHRYLQHDGPEPEHWLAAETRADG